MKEKNENWRDPFRFHWAVRRGSIRLRRVPIGECVGRILRSSASKDGAKEDFLIASADSADKVRYRGLLCPRGSILILALWSTALLGSFAVSMGYHVRQKITLADRIDNRNFLYGVAEMGIERAMGNLREKKEKQEAFHALGDPLLTSETEFRGIAVGDGSARFTVSYDYPVSDEGNKKIIYGVEDEAGKLSLNSANAETISNLLQIIAGLDEEKADEIAHSIVDWRDSNSSLSHPDYGAEDDYYEDLDKPYGAKDHDFQTLNELSLVRGMTPEIYEKIRPYVTVYGSGGVNINTAPKEVLLGLGFSETLAAKIMEYRSGTDRTIGTEDDRAFLDIAAVTATLSSEMKLSGAEINLIDRLVNEGSLAVSSTHFQVRSRGENWQKKVSLEIVAVAGLDGKIYSWRSEIPRNMSQVEVKEAEEHEKNEENSS